MTVSLWQDFVVTEIDQTGQLVELMPGNISSAKEEQQNPLNEKKQFQGQNMERQEQKRIKSDPPLLTEISGSFERLKDIAMKDLAMSLSSTKLRELTEFALHIENNTECNRKICIGSELSKEERTSLHRNVRLAFPYLQTETITNKQKGQVPSVFASSDKVYWEFNSLLTDRHHVDRLLCFAHWESRRKPSTLNLDVSSADKQQRTKIHRLLSKHFGSFLESKTFNNILLDNKHSGTATGQSYIQVRMRAKGTKTTCQKNNHSVDLRQVGNEYTRFSLCKRNMETLEAIHRLSRCLDIQPSAFSYAGVKDKKAITTQHMVVRGVTPEQMCAIEGHPSLEGIEIGSYRRGVSGPLRMGGLSGNHFKVVIRNMQCSNSHKRNSEECNKKVEVGIKEAVTSLSLNGFLNYFGPQRFGVDDNEVNACDIGLAMLQGNMVHAVKLLMTPSEHNPDHAVNSAKRFYCETGDVQGTLAQMPAYKIREVLVLKALHRHGTDMDGCGKALLNIPYSMRLLFVHSYCSLVWNLMASTRIQRYGLEGTAEGDLIVDPPAKITHDRKTETSDNGDCSDIDSCSVDNSGIRRDHVRCITNYEQGKHSLKDVVLPLPGYGVQYPANDVGEMYQKRLESDGLTIKSFRLRELGINVPGAYRKLVAFPADLSWKCADNAHARSGHKTTSHSIVAAGSSLAGNDTKRLRLEANNCHKDGADNSCGYPSKTTEDSIIEEEDSFCCNDVELSFSLRPSCYATSCLRELLKN
ncbi:pseudouridylate synthase PUS7L-like isoform X3 [Montipora capricornis]|uniref:pseudouridylate synthase PUS7L-like isoform X3 n=1 Tax=Montipora capricornis TaxID=246305 RepID=UPI0035F1BD20